MATSVDPDETPRSVASHLGLHCLFRPVYLVNTAINYSSVNFFLVSLTATSGNFRGFLCQARTDISAYSSTVGTLAPSGSVSMNQNCGLVSVFLKHHGINIL